MNIWLKRVVYTTAVLLALAGMMLITMPVQFAVVQLGLSDNVRIGHLSGTVWSGRATEVIYLGKIGALSAKDTEMDVVWEWCPGWIQGVMAVCARVESPLLKGKGTLAYSVTGGGFSAFDTLIIAQIKDYPVSLKSIQYKVRGRVDLNLSELFFDPRNAGLLTALRAEGKVGDLYVGKFPIGNYLWRTSLGNDGSIVLDFNGGTDEFTLEGQASLNLENRSYRYTADIEIENQGLLKFLKGRAKKSKGNTLTFSGDGKFGS